ncbi:hypothetical protein D9M68_941980 [compost metagenome]
MRNIGREQHRQRERSGGDCSHAAGLELQLLASLGENVQADGGGKEKRASQSRIAIQEPTKNDGHCGPVFQCMGMRLRGDVRLVNPVLHFDLHQED